MRQPCSAKSETVSGAMIMPPAEAPIWEIPSAVARVRENQLTTSVDAPTPLSVPAAKAIRSG